MKKEFKTITEFDMIDYCRQMNKFAGVV